MVDSIQGLKGKLLELLYLFVKKFPLWPSSVGLGLAFPFTRFIEVFLQGEDGFGGSGEEGGVREGEVCYF